MKLSITHQSDFFVSIAAAFPNAASTGLKPLCPTRWTARTVATKALLNNYEAVYDTLDEIIGMGGNTEASKKAPGLQALMMSMYS